MALSGNFSLRDVYFEFGPNTKPDTESLSNAYNRIMGSAPSGSRLTDFLGYGAPVITNLSGSTSSQDGGYIDVSYTVTINNSTTTVSIQIAEDTGKIVDEGDWSVASFSRDYTTNTSDTITLNVQPDTTYRVRLLYWNDFTYLDEIYHPDVLGIGNIQSSGEADDPIKLTDLTFVYTDGTINWRHWWKYPATSGSFQVEVSDDGGYTWKSAGINNGANYEGNDIWWGDFQPQELLTSGNLMQFRIKRSSTTEPWTDTQFFEAGSSDYSNLSQPSISTWSAQSIGETSATLRMNVSAFDNIAGQQYSYWWQYRVNGTSSWTSTSQSTASDTGTKSRSVTGLNDGTTYEYRAVARNTLGGTIQYGGINTFTTEEAQLSLEPTNFSGFSNGDGTFQLSWNTPSNGNPDNYQIHYQVNGGPWNIENNSVSGFATSYTTGDLCSSAGNLDAVNFRIRSRYGTTYSLWVESGGMAQQGCGGGGGRGDPILQ